MAARSCVGHGSLDAFGQYLWYPRQVRRIAALSEGEEGCPAWAANTARSAPRLVPVPPVVFG